MSLLTPLWLLLKLDQKHLIALNHVPWDPPCLQPSPHLLPLPPCPTVLPSQLPSRSLNMWRSIFPSGWARWERWTILLHNSRMPPVLNTLKLGVELEVSFPVLCIISNCFYVCLWYYCFLKVRIGVFLVSHTPWHLKSLLNEWINEYMNKWVSQYWLYKCPSDSTLPTFKRKLSIICFPFPQHSPTYLRHYWNKNH